MIARGIRLGVDVGSVRVGVARTDPDAVLATPLETLARGHGDLDRLVDLVVEHEAVAVIIGLPRSLSGGESHAAQAARGYAGELISRLKGRGVEVPIRMVDERMTTLSAQHTLRQAGRPARKQRSVVDQAAAAVILQHAMDSERATGDPPGDLVEA